MSETRTFRLLPKLPRRPSWRASIGKAAASVVRYVARFWYRYRKVSPRAKCPACGVIKRHKIVFDLNRKQVIHKCAVCEAPWAQAPVLDVGQWLSDTKVPAGTTVPAKSSTAS